MKKIMLLAVIVTALFSCQKENTIIDPKPEGIPVRINFAGAGGAYNTRAFFDNTAEAEPWEKEIESVIIYVVSPKGTIVMHHQFNAQDVSDKSGKVYLPGALVGTECTFYALVNLIPRGEGFRITWATNLNQVGYNPMPDLNGEFSAITSGAETPFLMSGFQKATIQPRGIPMDVSIKVSRPYAKLSIKTKFDPGFIAKYGKGFFYTPRITLKGLADQTGLFADELPSVSYDSSVSQLSLKDDDEVCNLFYINSHPTTDVADKIRLVFESTYDVDGNIFTNTDAIRLKWEIELNGSGNGEFVRNGYYRLTLSITDMDVLENLKVSVQAEEWETPITEDNSLDKNNQIK